LDVLGELKPAIAWMSIEPLSSDVAPLLEDKHLDWIVIGAASAGRQYFQPKPEWVMNLHRWADRKGISVFHKGNLTPNGFFRREEYPVQTGE
jgi:protein gp37